MTRLEICNELERAGVTTVGFAYNIDALVERAFQAWLARGSPRYAVVIIERDLETGEEIILVESPDGPVDLE